MGLLRWPVITVVTAAVAALFFALWLHDGSDAKKDILIVELGASEGVPDMSMPFSVYLRRQDGKPMAKTWVTMHNGEEPGVMFVPRGAYVVTVPVCAHTTRITTTGLNVFAIYLRGQSGRATTCTVKRVQ